MSVGTTPPRRSDGGRDAGTGRDRDDGRPAVDDPRAGRRGGGIGRWLLVILLVMLTVGLVAALLVARFVSGFDPFDRTTVDRTQPAVLLALRDISEYRAATGEFQVIVDTEETVRNLPLAIAGERTLFVAAGSVDAAVDFADIDEGAVTVDDARTRVAVRLPPAVLTDPRVDSDASYVFSRERGIVDRITGLFEDNPTSERDLYRLAEAELATAAEAGGLTEAAERNTEAMLRSLLVSLGFTDVTVTFDGGG